MPEKGLHAFIQPGQDWHVSAEKPVVYWMVREHRLQQNRALALAQQAAIQADAPLYIVTAFRKDLSTADMAERTFNFLLSGLQEVEKAARKLAIPFFFLQGNPEKVLPTFIAQHNVGLVLTDLFPLQPYQNWHKQIRKSIQVPLLVVDGHNSVPVWQTSDKQEYAARTIRPKLWKKFDMHQVTIPKIVAHPIPQKMPPEINWPQVAASTKTVGGFPVLSKVAGSTAAKQALKSFISQRLPTYAQDRNDPVKTGTSQLSAYFHFGHLGVTEVIAAIDSARVSQKQKDVFLEEFIIRKELAENFCYYQQQYNKLSAAPDWAQKTLKLHAADKREYQYSYNEFLDAKTHDPSWNAAQRQLLKTGYMHGYMRMYWAKKILEWTSDAQAAVEIAIRLNDLLELDGRDPNGYVGILWAIAGLHDRPWQERPIFGKVRYMNLAGLQRKFAIDEYIDLWNTNKK